MTSIPQAATDAMCPQDDPENVMPLIRENFVSATRDILDLPTQPMSIIQDVKISGDDRLWDLGILRWAEVNGRDESGWMLMRRQSPPGAPATQDLETYSVFDSDILDFRHARIADSSEASN